VLVAIGTVLMLAGSSLLISSTSASASASAVPKPPPSTVDVDRLTPRQLGDQVRAAEALRAALMKSSAGVAAANARLELLAAQANTLLANLSAARTAQVAAEADAAAQRARLIEIGIELAAAQDALGQLASDTYMRGGGPLGDLAAIIEAMTAPSADQSTDSLATVNYLVDGRARLVDRVQSLLAEQGYVSAMSDLASQRAAAAAKTAAEAKSKLDVVIIKQRDALDELENAQADQVGRAAGLRGALLRSDNSIARAADRRLAEALQGQDFALLMVGSANCGKDTKAYPNGYMPPSALCPLYAAPGESLRRDAAMAFNAMSNAYQHDTGSALCVADGYRPYAEQVAVHILRPKMTATPGTSKHGLGIAVDLCGGVQNFAAPAHLWMQRHAPLYGWFHPAWAEPTGVTPEPWHWEFAS